MPATLLVPNAPPQIGMVAFGLYQTIAALIVALRRGRLGCAPERSAR
ncbi:MAG TPA: hypothetical protein VFU22_33675 [Roseiflexaceae bacterium]|nr:hypothetical protein [Roseiflexaceae bacterium]